ncbi:PREDICTED: zinc finger protein 320-like isoform X2 [Atta colombica]|uniref:zinc finger protein 320-like isoform X2 n=1 Tax=Atta colombica TaxID=520822 RepID=UPI00084CE453|nr:PREDICTED: zinc finger protein 320-like isoform X2 [Atta colombica]
MCARVLACPLCSQPGFLTLDALRAGLVSVATRPLICPVCNEVLLGIDKLTIHLFGHTINLNNATAESSKSVDMAATNEHLVAIHNAHNIAPQNWNILKQLDKVESGNNRTKLSDSDVPNVENISAIDSQPKMQSLDSSTKGMNQSSFISDYNHDVIKVNILPQSNSSGNHNTVQKVITNLQQETNYVMQYFCNDIKHLNVSQEAIQAEKTAISDLIIATKIAETVDTNIYQDIEKECTESKSSHRVLKEKLITDLIEEEHDLHNFQSVQNIIANVCAKKSLEEHNDKEDLLNTKNAILETNTGDQNQNLEHDQILPHIQTSAKAIHTIAPKEKTERCNLCGFYFPDTNILALHEKLVHEQDSSNNPEKVLKNYSCYLCSKVFKMRGSLMVHMRVAHIGHNSGDQNEVICGDAGYACPTCGKKFKKEQHVIQHLKTHEGKQWECDTCSKMFTTKYFLKKHKRLHSGEMPYKCKICDKSFTFQQSYHKHRLYHKDDKPHTCATCGRSFKELSTLHNHERIHTGEKPFACETCGKCFRQRVSYLVHRRIHTGVMPYKCTMCGKSFRYKVSQRTHKCPVQTSGSTQQLTSDTREADNSTVRSQVTDTLQENQLITNTADEENKFVLIINAQGQPVLALHSEINNISSERKEQGIEFTEASNTNEDLKSKTWSNSLNSTGLKESAELIERVQSNNEKIDAKSTNDFFSIVMSPLETSISSSTFEMEHLRVSSPKHKENPIDSYTDFPQVSGNVRINLEPDIQQNFSHNKNVTESLQTINEESLKELLYGMDRK